MRPVSGGGTRTRSSRGDISSPGRPTGDDQVHAQLMNEGILYLVVKSKKL